jgi:hypothetical protein
LTETLEYNGHTYWRTRKYYTRGATGGREQLLHRQMWIDANGPIPAGYAIHHINGDALDNRVENLACVPLREHAKQHAQERAADPNFSAKMSKIATESAKRWTVRDFVCEECEAPFQSKCPRGAKYCSSTCYQRVVRRASRTLQVACERCAATFLTNKYVPARFCSALCADRFGWRKNSDAQPAQISVASNQPQQPRGVRRKRAGY